MEHYAKTIHGQAILIDGTCPLLSHQNSYSRWLAGGATAACATVGIGVPALATASQTIKSIGAWFKRFRDHPDQVRPVLRVDDIYEAKVRGQLGIIFHFQGSLPFEGNLESLETYYRLGLRMVQLCYNTADAAGCGCAVSVDTGLTGFGRELISECNRLGIVVDCAHTGSRTTLEAIAASTTPVVISHGNARAVHDSARNLPDEIIRAVADNGGTIGLNGYPAFVAAKERPTMDDLLRHADHIVKLVGVEHLALGIDYFEYQAGVVDDVTAQLVYQYLIDSGAWARGEYPPPPWYFPLGMELPEELPNLTAALLARGFDQVETEKILGRNLLRVFEKVWK